MEKTILIDHDEFESFSFLYIWFVEDEFDPCDNYDKVDVDADVTTINFIRTTRQLDFLVCFIM